MSEALKRYQEATKNLQAIRREARNEGVILSEDDLLDEMDDLWFNLSPEDKAAFNKVTSTPSPSVSGTPPPVRPQ